MPSDLPVLRPSPTLDTMADDETPWYRSLLIGVGAMLAVAFVVGGVISLVALGAVSVTGLGDDRVTVQEEPSLYIPSYSPTPEDDDPGLTLEDLGGSGGERSADADEGTQTKNDNQKKNKKQNKKPKSVISLSVSPLEVSRMERIYLTGTFPGGEGASLQVQRMEDGWTDFPVSASVSGGTFSTYVMTGRSGENRFRVVDPASGKKSNAVRVRVG